MIAIARLVSLALCALLALPAGLAAQQPAAVARDTAASMAECRSAGGRPTLTPQYQTVAELNGDGQPDTLIDLAGLNCEGAASYFCGSAGCPLVAYMSGPGGHRAVPIGHVQAWSLDSSGATPVLALSLHGSACGRVGSAGCERRVAWNGRDFGPDGSASRLPRATASPAPVPAPPSAKPAAPAADAAPAGAWQTRQGSDGRTVAIAAGPGVVRALTVLCHQGTPLVAVSLRARPPAGAVSLSFAGRSGRAAVALSPASGDTWIADLRGTTLPRLLAGDDPALDLAINGGQQGRLSLQGSTRSVREALAACHTF